MTRRSVSVYTDCSIVRENADGDKRTTRKQVEVVVPNGKTFVLRGFEGVKQYVEHHQVPVLTKVPYVNRVMTTASLKKEKDEIIVLVTPRIVVVEEEERRLIRNPFPSAAQEHLHRRDDDTCSCSTNTGAGPAVASGLLPPHARQDVGQGPRVHEKVLRSLCRGDEEAALIFGQTSHPDRPDLLWPRAEVRRGRNKRKSHSSGRGSPLWGLPSARLFVRLSDRPVRPTSEPTPPMSATP